MGNINGFKKFNEEFFSEILEPIFQFYFSSLSKLQQSTNKEEQLAELKRYETRYQAKMLDAIYQSLKK